MTTERRANSSGGPMVYVPSAEGVQHWRGLAPDLDVIVAEGQQWLAHSAPSEDKERDDG